MPGVNVGTPSNEEAQTLPARKSRLRMAVPDQQHCVHALRTTRSSNTRSIFELRFHNSCSIAFNACCSTQPCTLALRALPRHQSMSHCIDR